MHADGPDTYMPLSRAANCHDWTGMAYPPLLCGHGTADLLQCCSEGRTMALRTLDAQGSVTWQRPYALLSCTQPLPSCRHIHAPAAAYRFSALIAAHAHYTFILAAPSGLKP